MLNKVEELALLYPSLISFPIIKRRPAKKGEEDTLEEEADPWLYAIQLGVEEEEEEEKKKLSLMAQEIEEESDVEVEEEIDDEVEKRLMARLKISEARRVC